MRALKDFDQYKVLVITMDDLIFNLNQLRYDFSVLLYPKTFNQFNYQEYTKRLGTIKMMYSFIEPSMIPSINQKIENYIYDNKNLHNIKIKESADAFISLAKSRGLKIVIMTTHDATHAKQILAYRKLNQDVDQVISISDLCGDSVSIKMFHALANLYHVQMDEILTISSIASIFKCIQFSTMDSVFIPDDKNSYFDYHLNPTIVMTSLFDVLQYALFGKYSSIDLFKDFLGYDDNMDEKQKMSRYNYLKMKYENQPDILPIVDEVFSKENYVSLSDQKTQAFDEVFSDIEKQFDQMDFKSEAEKSATLLSFQQIRHNYKEEDSPNSTLSFAPSVEDIVDEPIEETSEFKEDEAFLQPAKLKEDEADAPEIHEEVISDPSTIQEPEESVSNKVEAFEEVVDEVKESNQEEKLIFGNDVEFTIEELEKTRPVTPVNESTHIFRDEKIKEVLQQIESFDEEEEIEEIEIEDERISKTEIFLTIILNFLSSILIISFGGIIYMCFSSLVESVWFLQAIFNLIFIGFPNFCFWIYDTIVSPFPSLAIQSATIITPTLYQYIILIMTMFILISGYKVIRYFTRKHFEED